MAQFCFVHGFEFFDFYPEVLSEHGLIVPPNCTQICQLVLIGCIQVTLNLLQR